MKLKVPYLKWRNGRPRWEPGPALRDKGMRGRDLKSESGQWLPLDRAIEAATALKRRGYGLARVRCGVPARAYP
jgi:hypothetical protein